MKIPTNRVSLCGRCGHLNEDDATVCVSCGYDHLIKISKPDAQRILEQRAVELATEVYQEAMRN